MDGEADMVDRETIRPAGESPREDGAAHDRRRGRQEGRDGEMDTEGEILRFEGNQTEEQRELTENETRASGAAPDPHTVEEGAVFGYKEAPEEILDLPQNQGKRHHGFIAVAVE